MCITLRLSSSLIGLGSIIFATQRRWADSLVLGSCAAVSQVFWWRAKRGGALHAFDGLIAKAAITHFILKTKMSRTYAAVLCAVFASAIKSHESSRRKWLSRTHVAYHAGLHVSCFVASMFALR
jgi:hypothetical protein